MAVHKEGSTLFVKECSTYGEQDSYLPTDLISYALALSWKGLLHDPTGLIQMGVRYYDPEAGRFLSPDPVGSPLSPNLYNYANCDPVNFYDPDGRFASAAYQTVDPSVMACNQNPGLAVGALLANSGEHFRRFFSNAYQTADPSSMAYDQNPGLAIGTFLANAGEYFQSFEIGRAHV